MEPTWRLRPHLRGAGHGGAEAGADHDRRHAPEGALHGGQPGAKGGFPRCLGRTKSKPHAVCDEAGRPILLHLTAGQVSDHKGARALLPYLPQVTALIADRGYDSNWFRNSLADRGTIPYIPPTKNRKQALEYDKAFYRQRHKIENMFAKLKDWRRIATRYDRCAHTFFSAICIAASVAFYLKE
jgi:transposase